jgi:hypothetical protein
MTKVKLEETQHRRRLHIGSYFVDLNETDYQELIRIFSDKSRKGAVIKSVCEHNSPDIIQGVIFCKKCQTILGGGA